MRHIVLVSGLTTRQHSTHPQKCDAVPVLWVLWKFPVLERSDMATLSGEILFWVKLSDTCFISFMLQILNGKGLGVYNFYSLDIDVPTNKKKMFVIAL